MEKKQKQTPDPSVAHIVQDTDINICCVKCFKDTGRTTDYLRLLNAATQFACDNCGEVYIYTLASRRALAGPATTARKIYYFNSWKGNRKVKSISYNDTNSLEGFTF